MTERTHWIGSDGYPDPDYLTRRVSAVISEHLRPADPDINFLQEMDGKDYARGIANAADDGEWLEQTKNLNAADKTDLLQLKKLSSLCLKLRTHVGTLNKAAWQGLSDGLDLDSLCLKLEVAEEFAHRTIFDIDKQATSEANDAVMGRRKKLAARMVTEEAAKCFEALTGSKTTITVDPITYKVSGKWIEFLASIFATVGIDASPERQARLLMDETTKKIAI